MATIDSGTYTPEVIQRRMAIAAKLLEQAEKPMGSWTQGLNQLARNLIGGHEIGTLERDEQKGAAEGRRLIAEALAGLGGAGPAPAPAGPAPAPAPGPAMAPPAARAFGPSVIDPTGIAKADAEGVYGPDAVLLNAASAYGPAIASKESGGNYGAVGPRTRTGDQGVGKFQVMGANVPDWTEAALGTRMTPQQFRADPAAQEAVFNDRFGQYVNKYGPSGAAKAWFAGEKGMNDPQRRDVLGTTVGGYERDFNAALGGAPAGGAQPGPQALALAAPGTGGPPPGTPTSGQPGAPAAPPVRVAQAGSAPNTAAIAAKLLANPWAMKSPAAAAVAGKLLEHGLKSGDPTGTQKEYAEAVRQGYKGSIVDYQKEVKAPLVAVQAESAERQERGKTTVKRMNEIMEGGQTAQSMLTDMTSLRDIASRVTTGKSAELLATLGPWAEAVGVKIEGLGDLQAFNAIVAKLAPQMRVPGSGATSDFDMRMFLQALPGLAKNPEGNRIIMNTFEAISKHKIAAADIASRYFSDELTSKEAEKALRELPDPLAMWRKARGSAPSSTSRILSVEQ